jgi:glyoxylase-like metal-dependent hydrolase (beta-lactamase superfamily II)
LIGHERVLIVDPGSADPIQLTRISHVLQGRTVEAVIFTHHHGDHVAGMDWCRQQGWPLWGSRPTGHALGVAWDRHLSDADRVQDWQVLHTPGHAAGHLALWHSATGILLSGDLVSGVSTILVPDEAGAMRAYLASLKRCIELSPRLVLPSHGGPFGPSSGLIERTLDHRLQRETKVCQALATGPIDFDRLLARVYDDVQGAARELARISLASHLRKLVEEGRAQQKNGHWRALGVNVLEP